MNWPTLSIVVCTVYYVRTHTHTHASYFLHFNLVGLDFIYIFESDNLTVFYIAFDFLLNLLIWFFRVKLQTYKSKQKRLLKSKKQINLLYVRHTGLSLESVEQSMERDKFMSPIEAKEFGLIDNVLKHPSKPTKNKDESCATKSSTTDKPKE